MQNMCYLRIHDCSRSCWNLSIPDRHNLIAAMKELKERIEGIVNGYEDVDRNMFLKKAVEPEDTKQH